MKTPRRRFLRQLGFGMAGISLASLAPPGLAAGLFTRNSLARGTPEAQGVSSRSILAFLDAVASSQHEFHSLMVLRRGHVLAEGWWSPYNPASPQMLYSLSKSFTSTGVGLAVAEGRLTVDDRVVSFFPAQLPAKVSDHLAALRVRDLLTMSVGHASDSTPSLWPQQDWVKAFLALEVPHPPGTVFLYNSGATYMLSAVVQKATGQTLIDFLRPRLFGPLGISEESWETCPLGLSTGGWGLKLRTESLARFGQLYLAQGVWRGRQVLPPAWVREATTFKIQQAGNDLERLKQQSDWHQGYCYQFWRSRHNSYRGDGAFGQYTIVLPEQQAVIAITSESPSMQGELDLIWQHLLPAMNQAPLPADKGAHKELKERLASLRLSPPKAQAFSPTAPRISRRSFLIPDSGHSVSFNFQDGACVYTFHDGEKTHTVRCGLEKWVLGETTMPGTPPKLTEGDLGPRSKVAASATWKDERTLEMTWRFYETPHHDTVTCSFDGDRVKVQFLNSLTKLSPSRKEKRLPLQGRLAS